MESFIQRLSITLANRLWSVTPHLFPLDLARAFEVHGLRELLQRQRPINRPNIRASTKVLLPGTMYYYLGDFGERLLTALNDRRVSSDFGASLKKMPAHNVSSVLPATAQGRRGGGQSLPRFESGMAFDPSNGPGNKDKKDEKPVFGTLQPGIMLVGVGSPKELVEKAKKAGIDGLLIFTVNVNSARNSTVAKSVTKFKLVTTADGKTQYSSRGLNHADVAKKRDNLKDSSKDPAQLIVNNFMEKVKEKFVLGKLPEMKSEQVKKRVEEITSSSPSNALPVAIEILNYHRKGLLSGDDAKAALTKIFDATGAEALINGNPAAKKAAIEKMAPRKLQRLVLSAKR